MIDIDDCLKNAIACNDLCFLKKNKYLYAINHRFIDEDNDTLLSYSISDPKSYMYSYFLENGADITLVNDEGEGIVHSIVYSGLPERLAELMNLDLFHSELLNMQTKDGVTPLMLSILLKKDEMFDLLLDLEVNINLGDMEGNTPIHPACFLGYDSMVEKLVEKGADLHIKTRKGNYPLALAVNSDQHQIVKYLYSKIYK